MNRVRWAIVALYFGISLTGCTSASAPDTSQARSVATAPTSEAKAVPAVLKTLPDAPLTEAEYHKAKSAVFRYEMAEYEKMTPAEKKRSDDIRALLQKERLDTLSVGPPAWVKDHLVAFEGPATSDFGAAYSRSVGWGTGTYKGKPFYYFVHTNSDAWLQMDLSVKLDEKDIDTIYGRKPDDREGAEGNPNRKIDVHLAEPAGNYTAGTATHIGTNGGVDWTSEFCAKLDSTTCDTAGAFDKQLLTAANTALPGLTFPPLKGRFPR